MYVDPAGGRMLFAEYAEQWRAGQVHRTRTVEQVESYLRIHAYPYLGERPLGSIRRSDVQAWVKQLTVVLAPGSVELAYRWVATIFKAAVGDRLIASSPCISITLPKRNEAEVVPLTAGEVEAMAGVVPDRYRALIVFAAGMGLRQGECFGLTVDRVDFLRRQVRVDRQLVSSLRGVPEFGPPRRARPASARCRCPEWSRLPWRPISPATVPASTGSCSPAAPATRSAATPSAACGTAPGRRLDCPSGRPFTTFAISTPRF